VHRGKDHFFELVVACDATTVRCAFSTHPLRQHKAAVMACAASIRTDLAWMRVHSTRRGPCAVHIRGELSSGTTGQCMKSPTLKQLAGISILLRRVPRKCGELISQGFTKGGS
jgi:hypothetical protein